MRDGCFADFGGCGGGVFARGAAREGEEAAYAAAEAGHCGGFCCVGVGVVGIRVSVWRWFCMSSRRLMCNCAVMY